MTTEQKVQVKQALTRYIASCPSPAQAIAALDGINEATWANIKNEQWDLITEHTWLLLARQVGFFADDWAAADTSVFLLLHILMGDAQHYTTAYGVVMADGLGKTFTARQYISKNKNVIYTSGREDQNRRGFMADLLRAAGLPTIGTVPELADSLLSHIESLEEPLLIIDNAHVLKDRVLTLLVTLANALTGIAGVVLMGREELRMRITTGVQQKKTGFEQVYNTFGQRLITMGRLGPRDIELICNANGVYDPNVVATIAEECKGNLHNIRNLIDQSRQLKQAA